jgi:hypothetical protein
MDLLQIFKNLFRYFNSRGVIEDDENTYYIEPHQDYQVSLTCHGRTTMGYA